MGPDLALGNLGHAVLSVIFAIVANHICPLLGPQG